MEDLSQLGAYGILGDVDPVPQSLLTAYPEQAKTLSLLYEVSRELTSILDREQLLFRVAQRVKRLVDYHAFSVMLWNEASQHLESVFTFRYEDPRPVRLRMALNEGITGTAAAERRSVRVNDVTNDARHVTCELGLDTGSELVIPLLLQDRLIGVLDLESTEKNAFTEQHERMLATLGSYIAVALENARLYEEARENQVRLQYDLNTARGIPGLDLAAAYVPARELGGDFYDFLPYGQGKLAMALGDVSGKGTAAALYGSLAIGTLRELVVSSTCNPASMLQMLNRRMYGARLDSRFIAMLFAVYDAAAHRLTLSNAGGPYPLLVRAGNALEIRVEGVPLGLFPDTEYDETTIDLLPGDVVLFASDGILESENTREEEFGSARLHALLANAGPEISANELSEKIIAATDDHSGPGSNPHDDRTLLVLRVTGEGAADYSKLPVIY
jgi:sigma-B regulation protein RsbU (phosphoserine phosphatase)